MRYLTMFRIEFREYSGAGKQTVVVAGSCIEDALSHFRPFFSNPTVLSIAEAGSVYVK
jgi:hypothetical protein